MDMEPKALVPAPPKERPPKSSGMSRRAAGMLMIIAGLLVVYHFAHERPGQSPGLPVIAPALHITLRGEVTRVHGERLTVRVENIHGDLTSHLRTVQLSAQTRIRRPGAPTAKGRAGLSYLQVGYRVLVHGLAAEDGETVNAAAVVVSFPPVTGTLVRVDGPNLTVQVPGQAADMTVTATSHTAFFVPGGDWSALKRGSPIRIWIAPEVGDATRFQALTVMVRQSGRLSR
jgi:hypothetical protein